MSAPARNSQMENLIARLAELPSIGRKSAQRLAYHLLAAPVDDVEALSRAMSEARRSVHPCTVCGNYAEAELCPICADTRRDAAMVCVLERPADIAAFERLGTYRGVYHVLGGALSPLDGIGPDQLRFAGLWERCAHGVREVILALGTHAEGEATAAYIVQRLRNRAVRVTRLARGLPAGSDLEFVDEITIQRALEGRVDLAASG